MIQSIVPNNTVHVWQVEVVWIFEEYQQRFNHGPLVESPVLYKQACSTKKNVNLLKAVTLKSMFCNNLHTELTYAISYGWRQEQTKNRKLTNYWWKKGLYHNTTPPLTMYTFVRRSIVFMLHYLPEMKTVTIKRVGGGKQLHLSIGIWTPTSLRSQITNPLFMD